MRDDPLHLDIHPDIRRARTPPAAFYGDAARYEAQLERVFARTWHVVADSASLPAPEHAAPCDFLPGSLDEPLVLTCDAAGDHHCMSNACTHRGKLVVETPGPCRGLRCGYHGRRFALNGRFLSMPCFEGARDFPSERDDLPALPFEALGPMRFTALDPAHDFDALVAPLLARCGHMPWDALELDPESVRTYPVHAHWALYCDNYLEPFHIPFVHPGLTRALDIQQYRTECFDHASLQLGVADPNDDTIFALPADHPDAGLRVAAFYFWLFPATMINVYPWGVSLNRVLPQGPKHTHVEFRSYVWEPALRDAGAGGDLHQVEMEDEAAVEATQRGLRARLYHRGRYSPEQELATHHFHRLMAAALSESPSAIQRDASES